MIESAMSVSMAAPTESAEPNYRKINEQLYKAIHSRNKKIKFLFDCLQQFQQIYAGQEMLLRQVKDALESNNSSLGYSPVRFSSSEIKSLASVRKSGIRKSPFGEDSSTRHQPNIFRRNSSIGNLKPKVFEEDKIKLPSISGKRHDTESSDQSIERADPPVHSQVFTEPKRQKPISTLGQSGKKVCRIPMERLVPLSVGEIKQRIEKRFK